MNTINIYNAQIKISLMLADKMYITRDVAMLSLFKESNMQEDEGIEYIKNDKCYLAMRDEDPIGYCINNDGDINKLFLLQDYKGMGIAKELIKKALENTPEKIDSNIEKFKDYDHYIKPV